MSQTVEVDLLRVLPPVDDVSAHPDAAASPIAVVIASEQTDGNEAQICAALAVEATVFVDDLVSGTGLVRVVAMPDAGGDFESHAVAATAWWFASLSTPVHTVTISGREMPADAAAGRVEFDRTLTLAPAVV